MVTKWSHLSMDRLSMSCLTACLVLTLGTVGYAWRQVHHPCWVIAVSLMLSDYDRATKPGWVLLTRCLLV